MSRTVYSETFLNVSLSGASDATYNIPDGYRAVVRDITLQPFNVDIYRCEAIFTFGFLVLIRWAWPPNAYWTEHWQGRLVLPGANPFTISNTSPLAEGINVHASGYLLQLP